MTTSHDDIAVPELADITVDGHTRAAFLLKSTLAAGAVFGAAAISPFAGTALAQTSGDIDILNYALTLEYLEADFYTQALSQAKLSGGVKSLVKQLQDDETQHVDALKGAIKGAGGKVVSKPTFDFGGAFADQETFLKYANTLEDTGVSAYNGAAPQITTAGVLGSAGAIVQIEARHAALIRLERGRPPAPIGFDKASEKADVLKAVKPFIK